MPREYDQMTSLAERSLLGAALLSGDAANIMLDDLREDDFGIEMHKIIYRGIKAAMDSGDGADVVTVAEQIRLSGLEPDTAYLVEIQSECQRISAARSYATMVGRAAAERKAP